MTALNQSAPPAAAAAGGDIIRFDPFPKADTYVATVVGYNYIPDHAFERTDDDGKPYTKNAPAVEFFIGAVIDGKPYFTKTWPQQYSISDRANYSKWYNAATGAMPVAGSKVDDIIGKAVLAEILVEKKTSKKGKEYTATKVKSVAKVPSILAATAVPLDKLRADFDKALAAAGDEANPF
jgi:hypothetical protein